MIGHTRFLSSAVPVRALTGRTLSRTWIFTSGCATRFWYHPGCSGAPPFDATSSALAAYGKRPRYAIDQTDELADQGTADIFTEISRGVDEYLWFVEIHVGWKAVESGHPVTTPDDRQLEDSVGSILASYGRRGELAHLEGGSLPSREVIWGVVEDLLRVLFPGYLETSDLVAADLAARTMTRVRSIAGRLRTEMERGLRFQSGRPVSAADREDCCAKAEEATLKLLARIVE